MTSYAEARQRFVNSVRNNINLDDGICRRCGEHDVLLSAEPLCAPCAWREAGGPE